MHSGSTAINSYCLMAERGGDFHSQSGGVGVEEEKVVKRGDIAESGG